MPLHLAEKMITKRVSEVDNKKCINFNDEFRCPKCRQLLVPVCVNLGTVKVGKETKLYCSRNFPDDCSKYGCPKYSYVWWLECYRETGKLEKTLANGSSLNTI